MRTYSLSDDPDGGYRISVKRESHGLVSAYLHAHLQRGDRVEVAAPRGDFVLDDGADPVLLISAGIGLTPVLAMLHRLASERSTREVWWMHTTHDADSHAFSAEVADLLSRLPSAHSLVYYTTPAQPLARGLGHPGRAPHRRGDRRARPADRRERVRLRPGVVHGRRHRRPGRRRPRPGPHPHRALRLAVADQPRRRRGGRAAPAPATRSARRPGRP